jgi:hypothetical protein
MQGLDNQMGHDFDHWLKMRKIEIDTDSVIFNEPAQSNWVCNKFQDVQATQPWCP